VRFTAPFWLPVGFVVCALLVWLWFRVDARQHAALARFVSPHLRKQLTQSISTARRRLQRGLLLTALALIFVTLAGPQLGYHWEQINRRGNEIVFIIDTSRSMMTPDVKPNRLDRAKLAIDDFTNHLDGDAVGIVAFAGSAFLVCPITLDYNAFRETLNAIDTNIVPRGGTNISSAIHEAQAALRRRPGSDKIVILITDGEDLEGSALTAAQNAKQQDGLRIFTVGVGTPGGDLIPVPPAQGGGFVKDESGQFVKSHLDEAGLKAIADATGGFYVPLGPQGEGLETIYNNVLGSLAKHDLASRQQKIYIERYQWPLAASLAALLLSLLIGNRRRRSRKSTASATDTAGSTSAAASTRAASATGAATSSTIALLAVASLILLPLTLTHRAYADAASPTSNSSPPTSNSTPPPSSAAPASTSGEPIRAYNAGTTAYRAGQFPQAAQAFQQSITHSPSNDPKRLADQEDAYYNLGNTLYRTGQKSEKSAPQDAIKTWTDAVKAYETALQLRPDDADSKYNRDLVKRKIAKLQQQKPPDQNKDKNDKDKNQDKGQGQGQGGGQGQGQPPPGQQPPQNQPPQQGQQPPGQQPPQGQPPPGQQQGQPPPDQQPGQQPPPGQQQGQQPPPGQQPGQQPPPGQQQGQQPPPGQQPSQQPPAGDQSQGQPPGAAEGDDARAADNQHLPGQMSREEARELLDSVKGDEKRPPGVPMAQDATDVPQQQPTKNW
jgi:Ca-activated chloride channel homolog